MSNKLYGKVFDIQRFSVHDGPGIRTDVFLKGCPLKCLWCHSPESQALEFQVAWMEIKCVGVQKCGKCLNVCPTGALNSGKTIDSQLHQAEIQVIDLNRAMCNNCGKCTEACPAKALYMTGRTMAIDEIMKIIDRDTKYYKKSGGGVTISGGEPMVQHRFTTTLLKECKSKALHTCLDTTGYAKWDYYKEVIKYVDLVLYDLKHMDTEKSRALTGVPNELILENARKIAAEGIALHIRIPIIPGYNDSEENLRATGQFCTELGAAVKGVQILPYHRLGLVKYERLHKEYQLEAVNPPSKEHMEFCKGLIESYGLKVIM